MVLIIQIKHMNLIKEFLKVSKSLFKSNYDSLLIISHKTIPPFNSWNISYLA